MRLNFIKMHGLGNDFMIVEWPGDLALPDPELVRQWGDRRTGVGFDSLLIVEPGARYRIFNADGGEAGQCGNGARCIAAYLADGRPQEIELTSAAGKVSAKVGEAGIVSINLGVPDFSPASLPFLPQSAGGAPADRGAPGNVSEHGPGGAPTGKDSYRLTLESGDVEFGIVSMGNPHAVIRVDSVDDAPVGIIGAALNRHPSFPEGVNVGFAQKVSSSRIRLRVYERGVGETQACGTGAAAAAATGRRRGELDARVEVELPGGTLEVDWPGEGADLWQTGQTTKVFEGLIEI